MTDKNVVELPPVTGEWSGEVPLDVPRVRTDNERGGKK